MFNTLFGVDLFKLSVMQKHEIGLGFESLFKAKHKNVKNLKTCTSLKCNKKTIIHSKTKLAKHVVVEESFSLQC